MATPVTTPVATPVTTPAVTVVTAMAPRAMGGNPVGEPPSTGVVGAHAVWSTGFWTWVDLTDCMMMGEWVLAWRADQACIDEERLEPDRIEDTGEGHAGMGDVAELPLTRPVM